MAKYGAVELKNFTELQRAFNKMQDEVQKKLGEQGVKAAAKLVLEDAQRRVSVKTGKLRDSLIVRKINRGIRYKVLASGKKGGHHAALVEFGTAPHIIPKAVINGKVYRNIKHPGTKKEPFLRPALIENIDESVEIARLKIMKGITKILKKELKNV